MSNNENSTFDDNIDDELEEELDDMYSALQIAQLVLIEEQI